MSRHVGFSRFTRFNLTAARLRLLAKGLLLPVPADLFLYRFNDVWMLLPKTLGVEMLDILPERHLPRFLAVVVQFAKRFGIHPQFAGHLDLGMR